jgi:hypothetical protein
MSDASAEAERVNAALRSRGYWVVDVPLGLLAGRVAVQRPSLVVCDADAPGTLETMNRMQLAAGGRPIEVLLVGASTDAGDEAHAELERIASGFFARPIDPEELVNRIEQIVGPAGSRPSASGGPPAGRSPVLVAASRRPYRYEGSKLGQRGPLSGTPSAPSTPPTSPPSGVPSSAPAQSGATPSAPAPSPNSPSSAPSLVPPSGSRSSLPPVTAARGGSVVPQGIGAVPHARLSPELELLLGRAEQRVRHSAAGAAAQLERLSPDAEVEAILPADLLAALDEPLHLEDDDDSEDDSVAGTAGGSESGSRNGRTADAGTPSGSRSLPRNDTTSSFAKEARIEVSAPNVDSAPEFTNEAPTAPPARQPPAPPPPPPPPPPSVRMITALEPPELPAESRPTHGAVPSDYPPPSAMGLESASTKPPQRQEASRREPPRHEPPARHDPVRYEPPPRHDPARYDTPSRNDLPRGEPPPSPDQQTNPHAPYRPVGSSISNPPPPHVGPSAPDIPATLGSGGGLRALARAVAARFTGAVAFEDASGIRRVVFRDGDFVTAASSAETETLVAFLAQRGDLSPDATQRVGRRLPPFGRHAGAALVAQGHLRQDELWSVLRAHAEWLIARVASMQAGAASLEHDVPQRLHAEPGVFGGATGAEVLVEMTRRVVAPADAITRLGGREVRLFRGDRRALLAECALADAEVSLAEQADGGTLGELLKRAGADEFACVLWSLVELGVLQAAAASSARNEPRERPDPNVWDPLDATALRKRIAARRALVEEGDYFALLGVSRDATTYDLRRAYQTLRSDLDPATVLTAGTVDLRDDVDTILEVLDEAYDILRDPVRRERYRRALEASPH